MFCQNMPNIKSLYKQKAGLLYIIVYIKGSWFFMCFNGLI